jgi:hypothetical protein
MADTEQGKVSIDEDFEWGFSFSDNDDSDLDTVVKTVTSAASAASADLSPLMTKLDAILALLPDDFTEVDTSSLDNKLDQIIALERVDALTAGDMPDMSAIDEKLDTLLGREVNATSSEVNVDLSEITENFNFVVTWSMFEDRRLDKLLSDVFFG